MRPARSLLLVPGTRPEMLDEDSSASADAVIVDIVEAISATARRSLHDRLAGEPGRRWWIRTTPSLLETDIDAAGGIEGVVLRAVRSPEDLLDSEHSLAAWESKQGRSPGSTGIILQLDNAKAVFFAYQLATASRRVASLCFNGAEHGDLAGDLACSWSIDGPELMYARQYALVAARAADIGYPLDGPFANFDDLDGLARDTEVSRRLGYRGRVVIDARQIEIVNRIYSPTAEEVAYHQRVLEALDAAIAEGRASVTLDGKMIDYAHAATARAVIEQARELGVAP